MLERTRRQAGVGRVLAGLTLRIWFNGLERSLGARWAAGLVLLVPVTVLLAWLVVGTSSLTAQLNLSPGVARELGDPLATVVFTMPAVTSLLISVYSVGRTTMDDLIALLPITRAERKGALRWLAVVMGTVVGLVWTGPLTVQYLAALDGGAVVLAVPVCVVIAVLGSLTAQVLFSGLQAGVGWVLGRGERLPQAVAGSVTAFLLAWACLSALPVGDRVEASGPLALLGLPLRGIADADAAGVLGALALLATAVVGSWLLGLVDGLPARTAGRRRLRPVGPVLVRSGSLTGLEIRQWLRFPFNATLLLFGGLLLVAYVAVNRDAPAPEWTVPAYGFLVLVATAGVGSYGPTRPALWVYAVSGRPLRWVAPKLLSVVLLWALLTVIVLAVLLAFTTWDPDEFPTMLPTVVVELLAGCVVGLVIPVGREQSLGNVMSEFVALLVVLSIAFGVQSLPWADGALGSVLTHVAGAVALLGAYVLLARSSVGRGLADVT